MTYSQPTDLAAALSILRHANPQVIAGGTDVYPTMPQGGRPGAFLDVTRISGLDAISESREGMRIGAAVTWSDVMNSDLPPAYNALRQAAREIGSLQIQNAATIAGNICNASPAADGVPALLALEAEVELASSVRGTRVLPLGAFIRGARQTALADDELMTAVLIPETPPGMVSAFEKLGSRRYLVISIVMTAANVLLDKRGRIAEARIAVGSCSAVAQRLAALEADLAGEDPSRIKITPEHLRPLAPIDDVRGTGTYRLAAAEHLIRRAVMRAITA